MAVPRRPKKLDAEALWNYALRALENRSHSTAELRRKLLQRAASSSDITPLMQKLREYGLADDEKFSETLAASRLANQGVGRFRVLRELRSKQVAATVAEKAVNSAFAGTDEQQLADAFLVRKYRGKELDVYLKEEKNVASAYRRLRTAGFSSKVSFSVLKKHSRKIEEWDEPEEPPDSGL